MRPPLGHRLQGFGTTIFAEMSALAVRTGAITLGQGFPDTDGPAEVIEAAVAAMRDGANQYPPGPGVPELREAIAGHQRRFYGIALDLESEVLVTTGATEAIAAALLALCEPGDEVVTFEPYYDSYGACIAMAGATRRPVTLRPPGFELDPDALAITDEVYEHLTFDGRPHVPLATLPGMAERTLTISSAGKTFSVTGWKIGWATGPAPLVAAVRAAKQFLTFV